MIDWIKLIKTTLIVIKSYFLSVQIVGRVNFNLASKFPISVIEIKGDICYETPPNLSFSAKAYDILNSYRVSEPNIDPTNVPSGSKLSSHFIKTTCKSLTQCKFIFDTINYKWSSKKGQKSSSQQIGTNIVLLF